MILDLLRKITPALKTHQRAFDVRPSPDIRTCPECGGTVWLIDRATAQCADTACGMPLPLRDVHMPSDKIRSITIVDRMNSAEVGLP